MRFRDAIALNTVPLLLRVMLAATFLWFGLPKFSHTDFTGSDAATLAELGIGRKTIVGGTPPAENATENDAEAPANPPVEEPPAPAEEQESPDPAQPPAEQPSSQEQQPATDQSQPEQPEKTGAEDQGSDPIAEQPPTETEAQDSETRASDAIGVEVHARRVESLTIMLHNAGHPAPQIFAWVAMTTEIVGGALLVIGLFSRVWGLGLAVAMGYAFYFTVLPVIHASADPAATNPLTSFISGLGGADFQVQMSAFFQLSLFVAAWCVFIGGPGACSLDRLIFGGGGGGSDD